MIAAFKKIVKNYIIVCILSIALGIALVIEPTFLTRMVSYVFGGLALAYGVFNAAKYFTGGEEGNITAVIKGVMFAFVGVFLIVKPDFIPRVISTIFGLYMLINGVIGLTNATQIKRTGDSEWLFPMVSAGVTFFLGFIICINPMLPVNIAMTVLGISLIVSGASSLFSSFTAKSKLKSIEKAAERAQKDNDIIDI
ncbi:MAG: DUF308 domain-containing protein [Ruminococcus sp.]|nr:DUF308 domain-containing protein [Ruminococcus sp.]